MPNVNIRKLPDKTYKKIKHLAKLNGRSINSQMVCVLNEYSENADINRTNQSNVFNEILRLRKKSGNLKKTNSVKLIREMRDEVN